VRIHSVVARRFGPFTDQTLELSEGLTLVWGANEAGKSSWHAALYAGLCGVRRSKGGPRTDDRAFRDRHRPWDGNGWAVELLLELAGGRLVRLQHDLDGGRESRAWDDALGRDVSGEITHDGTPDASRWLGLDRRTFLAVACVRQGDILAVRASSEALRDYLERAAASASSDGTAAAAIDRIGAALSEMVGSERTGSTKPLRRALDRLAQGRSALDAVRHAYRDYQGALDEAESLRLSADEADRQLTRARLARAIEDHRRVRARVDRIRELITRHPGGPPVRSGDDRTVQLVAGALRSWSVKPEVTALDGTPSQELRRQLDALPEPPDGDCAPHPTVVEARRVMTRAAQALELHDAQRPAQPMSSQGGDLSATALRELARSLDEPVPALDPVLDGRRRQRQSELDRLRARRRQGLAFLAGGALCLAGGVAALLAGWTAVGAVLLFLAAGGLTWWLRLAARGTEVRLLEELRDIESQLGGQRHNISLVLRRQQAAREEAAARGVKADAASLLALSVRVEADERLRGERERWNQMRRRLVDEVAAAQHGLEAALAARGIEVASGVDAALVQYEAACQSRLEQSAASGMRAGLQRELTAREALERARDESMARRAASEAELLEAGLQCGISGLAGDELAAALRNAQAERLESTRQFERDSREWAELEQLLDGASLERIARDEAESVARVDDMRARLGPEEGVPDDVAALDADLPRLETVAGRRADEAAEARGMAAERARDLASVAEAEEAVAAAAAELDRVRRVERTLTVTLGFLQGAQERVHRDLAPILASTMRNWLSTVTDGRYVDVRVDPESLGVTVRDPDGRWWNAELLSQGTTEQIYLALRMAMALHLTPDDEPCPLIFDEVTVQSDAPRTEAMLRTLHGLSASHQVILFSQEQHVLDWAERHVTDRDSIVRLDAPAHAASWPRRPSEEAS
jgi:exonuclease SbcC